MHQRKQYKIEQTTYVPYINDEIKSVMNDRDTLKEEAAKSGNPDTYSRYKTKRNEVTSKMKHAKTNYYKQKFEDQSATSSDVWKTASQVLGKVRSTFPSQIVINGKLLSKPIEMATAMNHFFIKKIAELKD